MALILNIETGTNVCSAAISENGRVVALRESDQGHAHAQNLAPFIDELLRENEIMPDELDAVAVSKGPGSYTGLRIGTSTAKGLCYALGIPLIAVGSLESLARVAIEDYEAGVVDIDDITGVVLCPMIDARRMEVYAQVFDGNATPLSEVGAHVIDGESFAEFIGGEREFVIFGDGAAKCVEALPAEGVRMIDVAPSARGLARPAYEAFLAKRFEDTAYFEPFYLKDFVVSSPKKNVNK
jgi:universal bacterial protein YeaZ